MLNKIKKFFSKHKPHRCKPIEYPETGEVMIFHCDINWFFSQEFTVCQECNKVKVTSEITNGDIDMIGEYKKEIDGTQWSGQCDYAKVPSIGRDKLTFSRN